MPYSGLVAYRLSFIDIDGATVISDPLSSQEFARKRISKTQIYPCKHLPLVNRRFFLPDIQTKAAPCAAMQQGAGSARDYLRSLIIPFVTEPGGQKSGK